MKNMEEKQVRGPHKLVINNRQTSLVTGVLDVLSFDLNEVLLETEQGMLMVKGMDLHVNRLNLEKGEAEVEGRVDSLLYLTKNTHKKDESILKRMFR